MEFTSKQQLELYLKQQMRSAMIKAEEEVYQVIRRFVKEFYAEFTPKMYVRTYMFYKSLTKTEVKNTGNGYEFEVYFDVDKVDYYMRTIIFRDENGNATQKKSVINKGNTTSKIFKRNIQGYHGEVKGTASYEEAIKILKTKMIPLLKQRMKESGIPVI